jgi:hypothetical protein
LEPPEIPGRFIRLLAAAVKDYRFVSDKSDNYKKTSAIEPPSNGRQRHAGQDVPITSVDDPSF